MVFENTTLNGALPLVGLALNSLPGAAEVLLTLMAEEAVFVTVPPGPVAVNTTK